MQFHGVQEIQKGRNEGRFVYATGSYPECCEGGYEDDGFGHATKDEARAHMREKLLTRLRLDVRFSNWSGCHAPGDGRNGMCDVPTKGAAEIPSYPFMEPLCDEHRTREVVEAMWDGPGDWSGSY